MPLRRGKQPRVLPCSKGKYGVCRSKFSLFFGNFLFCGGRRLACDSALHSDFILAEAAVSLLSLTRERNEVRVVQLKGNHFGVVVSRDYTSAVKAADVAKWQTQRT